MRVTNPANFVFSWPEGSDVIEVFRKHDPVWAPFEAIYARGMQRSESNLNKVANESSAYAKEL